MRGRSTGAPGASHSDDAPPLSGTTGTPAEYDITYASEGTREDFEDYFKKAGRKESAQLRARIESLRNWGTVLPPGVLPLRGVAARTLGQFRLRTGHHRVFLDVDTARRRVVLLAVRRRNEATYDE